MRLCFILCYDDDYDMKVCFIACFVSHLSCKTNVDDFGMNIVVTLKSIIDYFLFQEGIKF
jgi:hypothetical protein